MDAKTIYNSIVEFNNNDIVTKRSALGNGAKYFPYIVNGGNILFCLSKFCQFEDATLASYIGVLRKGTVGRVKGGGQVKSEIERALNKSWVSFNEAPIRIKEGFTKWISNFYATYPLSNANFIEVKHSPSVNRNNKRKQTKDELLSALEQMRTVGELGEVIALAYEHKRLKSLGCSNPKEHIRHISLEDQGAGYDIISNYKGKTRLIEVKATTGDIRLFYLSSNELNVLSSSPEEAFIYLVKIDSLEPSAGNVVRELSNPINSIIKKEPILFKVQVK